MLAPEPQTSARQDQQLVISGPVVEVLVVALIPVLHQLVALAARVRVDLAVAVAAQAVPLVVPVVVVEMVIASFGGGRCLTFQYRTLVAQHAPSKFLNRECLRLG